MTNFSCLQRNNKRTVPQKHTLANYQHVITTTCDMIFILLWLGSKRWLVNRWRHITRATYIAACNVQYSTATVTSRQLSTPSLSTQNSILNSADSYKESPSFTEWITTTVLPQHEMFYLYISLTGLTDACFDLLEQRSLLYVTTGSSFTVLTWATHVTVVAESNKW